MALHIQYAHDSRQKRVGGKTAAAPNKGCSTHHVRCRCARQPTHTYTRTDTRSRHTQVTRMQRDSSARIRHTASIYIYTRGLVDASFFWPRVPLSHSCVSVRREVGVSIRCNVHVPVRVRSTCTPLACYACVCMPRTCIRCAGLCEWRHMMTISVIFPGVRAGSDALARWSFGGLTAFSLYFQGFGKSDITEDSQTVIKLLIFID